MGTIITEQIDQAVDDFKKRHGLHRVIAFAGGADATIPGIPKDDPMQAQHAHIQEQRELRIVREALTLLQHDRIVVLTGGTKYGFPRTATKTAKEMGIHTIGVFPRAANEGGKKRVLEDLLDLAICVNPHYGFSAWGDESSVFCKLLDAVIVCGGGAGTLIEMAHILKMNESLRDKGLPLKSIVPIHNTGGVADGLPFIWGKQEIKNACMPQKPILSGLEAGTYIKQLELLYDLEQ